jgi:type II secretory pathway component PulF
VSGTIIAADMGEALKQIRAEGRYPISVKPGDQSGGKAASRPGIKIARLQLIHLSTQLSIMIETGVTLSEALDCIAKQATLPRVRELVTDLSEQLQAGASLSEAMGRHPRSFPLLYVALIRASEQSGMLSRLLNRATEYLRDESETLRRVKGAMIYPFIMFTFAMTTTIFLLIFVLPRFTVIYASKRAALPAPTQILMSLSEFVIHDWQKIVMSLATAAVAGFFFFRTDVGRRFWHTMQLRLPLFGALYRKLHLSRGLRMVGTMAGAGVPLMDCVNTAHDLCGNFYFRQLWEQIGRQIQTGRQLSEPLFQSPLVPRSTSQMISSGEKSGKLASVMEQVAVYAEQELKEQIASLTRYIEPVMIVVMGLIIGGVSMALLLPVFTISKVMAH